ncbi:MAG: hypothetical protein IPG95_00770 [Saprospiraceae bacterium]|nr:hypothetical protein [Saprospiraceae bacterium]
MSSLTEQRIELPVLQSDFWNPGPDSIFLFEAAILEVNAQSDENLSNNIKGLRSNQLIDTTDPSCLNLKPITSHRIILIK